MATSPVSQIIRFDVFELDLRTGELRKRGVKIRLQEQPFLILRALLENPGQIVTREELKKKIWPEDTFVDFDHGLHAAVNRLREALNDSADNPRFVETLARRGYRFVGQIAADPQNVNQVPVQPVMPASSPGKPEPFVRNSWTGLLAGFVTAIVIGVILVGFNVRGLRDWLFGSGRGHIRSLAVLPLENVTSDPEHEYISEGMTEDLTTQLSQLQNLKVISHTSVLPYKKANKPLREVARELNVDAIVEGAVELAGNHVRITAQLVDAATDQHIWAQTYDREFKDVLILQAEVTQDIAKQIALELTPQQQQKLASDVHPVNPEAYQDYWLGRYYWNQRTASGLAKAGQFFGQAIQKDPNYAPAYSGLSDYYAFLTLLGGPEVLPPSQAMAKAKSAAEKAVQLDGSSAEAHASRGHILHNYDWNFDGAEREFKKAIELNPNYATAHHWYAHLLMQVGRTQQALEEAERAQQLDPMSPFVNQGLARQYYLSRQYDKSIYQCRIALEKDAAYLPSRIQVALDYEQQGMTAEAVSELEQARSLAAGYAGQRGGQSPGTPSTDLPIVHGMLGYAYARAGRTADAQNELAQLKAIGQHRYVPPSYLAIISMALGHNDDAFSWLNRAYQDRSEQMLYLGVEPIVDPLRDDPRFDDLLRKVGLKR